MSSFISHIEEDGRPVELDDLTVRSFDQASSI